MTPEPTMSAAPDKIAAAGKSLVDEITQWIIISERLMATGVTDPRAVALGLVESLKGSLNCYYDRIAAEDPLYRTFGLPPRDTEGR